MRDAVYESFLLGAREDAERIGAESDAVRLVAAPRSGSPPAVYHGLLSGAAHFVRDAAGIRVSADPIPFTLQFPGDYLRSADPDLQFRVVFVHAPLVHPNCRGGLVCLGPGFRPGTRLRALVEQAYGILASRVFAPDHALDPEARDFFLHHIEEVRRLRASPLWRRPLAARVRVEPIPAERLAAQEGRA